MTNRRCFSLRLCSLLAGCVVVLMTSLTSPAAGQVQTGPITEPRGHEEPAAPVAKGAKAITEHRENCATRLSVTADALFKPHRWTLNPEGAETLDVLGPMIAKSGKHPARIVAYTGAADSESENRDVSERRAITVRTWLVNHGFLPQTTSLEGFSAEKRVAGSAPKPDSSVLTANREQKNGTIEVALDTCSQ